jgi:hypothetical protein
MNPTLLLAAVVGLSYASFVAQPAPVAETTHITYEICHVPPGEPANAHIITIDAHAWNNGHSPHNTHAQDENCTLNGCPTCRIEPGGEER